MKFKFGTKQIVLTVVAVLLIGVMIVGNILLNSFSFILHGFFGGYASTSSGGSGGGAQDGETPLDYADRIVQEVAEDSIVLLKNDEVDGKPYLPLPLSTKFALFGYGATDNGFLLVGGGSGGTNVPAEKPKRVTLTEAFDAAGVEYNEAVTKAYSDYSTFDADYRNGGSTGANAVESLINPPESWYSNGIVNAAKNDSDEAIVVLSRWGCENGGAGELKNIGRYSNGSILELTDEEKAMFTKLKEAGLNVTVLLNTTNYIELSFLNDYDNIKACLYIGIPGQSGAMAIPNILLGNKPVDGDTVEISPSGKLSDTLAYSWQENSSTYGNAGIGDNAVYQEGIYVGYKWYETASAEGAFDWKDVVQYPFGYGLSYTSFKQSIVASKSTLRESADLDGNTKYSVVVEVENTGDHAGKDVVQLYYTPPYTNGGIEKASVNLLAFAKTGLLKKGEKEEVTLTFSAYDMASYDMKNGGYVAEAGEYAIKLMSDAHNLYGEDETSLYGEGAKASDKNVLTVNCKGITFDKDPFTGNEVKNLFTGNTAYADMPTDGSKTGSAAINYLSRKDKFANRTALGIGAISTNSAVTAAKGYDYNGFTQEQKDETADYEYDMEYGLRLTGTDAGYASLKDLDGTNKDVELVVDSELIDDLSDYESTTWIDLLSELTQSEIQDIMGKAGFQTIAIEGIGKPLNVDKDGPAGFNNNVSAPNGVNDFPVYPAETLSGCSWNTALMREIGRAQGMVGVLMNVRGWYGPGVNLHRSPYNSRNYEYYSEDGVLSGWLAAATINGAKEENVYCYLKHFVLAESGENSKNWNTWIEEQALRENYCKPFEIAVKVSINDQGELEKDYIDESGVRHTGANGMMSAFNGVGAVWAGYNHALLTTMLREEWGFRGSVITDWNSDYMGDFARAVKAGNNLWLDGSGNKTPAKINFNDPGQAYAARQSVKNILYTYVDTLHTSGQTTTSAGSSPFSPLFVTLWALIDVVLVLGIAACVLFIFWTPGKKKLAAESAAEAPDAPETDGSDGGTEPPAAE